VGIEEKVGSSRQLRRQSRSRRGKQPVKEGRLEGLLLVSSCVVAAEMR